MKSLAQHQHFRENSGHDIKWPMALAADIAVKALLTSTFEQTLMCVMDEATRVVYQGALDPF